MLFLNRFNNKHPAAECAPSPRGAIAPQIDVGILAVWLPRRPVVLLRHHHATFAHTYQPVDSPQDDARLQVTPDEHNAFLDIS